MEWDVVTAVVVSISDSQLWIGADIGLFSAEVRGGEITTSNVSSVLGEVGSLAWRSSLSSRQPHSKEQAFLTAPTPLPLQHLTHSGNDGVHQATAKESPCHDCPQSSFGLLVVGTEMRVYFFDGSRWWFEWASVWYYGLGGVVDGPPSALSFTSTGELFIADNVSLSRLNVNYTFDRFGPLQGLPYNQLQALHFSPYVPHSPPTFLRSARDYSPDSVGTLWIGSTRGFVLLDITSSKFIGYFYGKRWHPGDEVLGFASSGQNATVVLTDAGISVLQPQLWTLGKKAQHYQAMLARHTRPPGKREMKGEREGR